MTMVVVIKADDIIFFEVLTVLYLNNLEWYFAPVFQAVFTRHRDVGAFIRVYIVLVIPICYSGSSGYDHPVLTPMIVKLMR